ncbi:metal ABC transporter permease [Carboxylicivirga mesophila]|uniref:Metal ABC transporter permease n=1 Tax=Carboxylicivirga mesophila TaxID=1166478 RepID=A0ABS5K6H8_9BACT|nr:metal ABC transporter permease [Carboxylicivirga mesophila]MBS2210590.1 metal ABC transporter permease [Carboxylicivirga mesophila]
MNELLELFSFAFFRNALLAAFLSSIIAGIVGSYIVARRNVFISSGITHASFGGMGIAYYLGFPPFLGAGIFAVLSALGIEWSSSKAGIREDSSIAILWSLGMAIGILFVFLTPGYTPNLMGFLFGDILTVKMTDLIWLAATAVVCILLISLYYQAIVTVAFDTDFAKVSGLPVQTIKYISAALVSIAIVLSIKVMGIILVLSLFTIPAAAANLFAKNLNKVMIGAVLISVIGSMSGLLIAYFLDIPSGATIIFTLTVLFVILKIIKLIR